MGVCGHFDRSCNACRASCANRRKVELQRIKHRASAHVLPVARPHLLKWALGCMLWPPGIWTPSLTWLNTSQPEQMLKTGSTFVHSTMGQVCAAVEQSAKGGQTHLNDGVRLPYAHHRDTKTRKHHRAV
jgi:hypothetical protein